LRQIVVIPTPMDDWDEEFERECGYLPPNSKLPSLRRNQVIAQIVEDVRRRQGRA
jgi:hypothetical protein